MDDVHEHVTAVGQDEYEGPEAHAVLCLGINPRTEIAEVDLSLLAEWRIIAQDGDGGGVIAFRPGVLEVPVEGGQAAGEMILVVETLPDGARVVGPQSLGDLIVEGGDLGEDRGLMLLVGISGEIGADELVPLGGGTLRLAWLIASGFGNGYELSDGFTPDAQALSDLTGTLTGMPMLENFDDIAHGETPSCHMATP